MSILDEFFDDRNKINYKHSNILTGTGKLAINTSMALMKNTGKLARNVYYSNILWCKSFYKTDIYIKCKEELCKQLKNCEDEEIGVIPTLIELPFASDYWYGDIQRKYNKQQLRRIEQEFDDEKTGEELCYEMLFFVWNKMMPKQNPSYCLTENDIFKIKNRCKEE